MKDPRKVKTRDQHPNLLISKMYICSKYDTQRWTKKTKGITPTERLELSTLRSRRFVKVSRASQLCHAGWSGYVILAVYVYYITQANMRKPP